ncbi:DUF3962 domain-containing protein [Kitasatospora sp. NPDC097643]|uniref:pPIWI_RE module domain-containing protein n=1 Tax=Kitasatospora sp. NPDC097643 TaxID=3157230 RepID=UPI00331F1937
MEYQRIRAAAYRPVPGRDHFTVPMHCLTLPAAWEEPLLALRAGGRPERRGPHPRRVPTKEINQLLRATAPDIVTVDATATFGAERPWLYCTQAYPQPVTNMFVAAWLRNLQRNPEDPESASRLLACFRDLDTDSLHWQARTVDLLEQQPSMNGTANPAPHVYRLLADHLAARIAAQPPYEHGGKQLAFHQVAGLGGARGAGSGGAELMSWPPIKYRTKRGTGTPAYYSATLRVTVRTVPFSPVPRVHLSAGVRRFVSGQVWLPYRKGASVYLLPDSSLVPNGPSSTRFSVATLQWRNGTTEWRQGGAGGMLAAVTALDHIPSPERLVKEAEHWIGGRDGIQLAVGHQTAMGSHSVHSGLMPSERRRVVEWAEQALLPDLMPAPYLERSRLARPPKKQLRKLPAIPKKETLPEKLAAILDTHGQISAANAATRRRAMAEALPDTELIGVLLYQSDGQRDRLVAAAEKGLGLVDGRAEHGPSSWTWKTPELTVRLHAHPLGALGEPLGRDRVPRIGIEHDEAIADRRRLVSAEVAALRERVPGAQLALVELEGLDVYRGPRRRADPKHAIRLGCADGGLVTQFIRPLDTEGDPEKAAEEAALRAEAAWADALRQLGLRLVPQHTLGELIPEGLNQVAFHLVERRSDGPTGKPQFTPIAVLLRPGATCVLGRSADMQEWVPYPVLLKSLTGRVRDEELRSELAQSALTAAFIKNTLSRLRSTPTLVLAHAQDIRKRWPWLRNDGLERDRLGLDGGPTQRLGLYGKGLRIVRIADATRDETAQWWAEREELTADLAGQQRGGIAKGLWVPTEPDASGRVFYSTADKSSTQTGLTNDDAKLTPHVNPSGRDAYRPTANAWNPSLLEVTVACLQPGDDAEAWAAFVHQQRFSEEYRDALGLPLVLHLARLADQYALPHEDEDDVVDPTDAADLLPEAAVPTEQLFFAFDTDE